MQLHYLFGIYLVGELDFSNGAIFAERKLRFQIEKQLFRTIPEGLFHGLATRTTLHIPLSARTCP